MTHDRKVCLITGANSGIGKSSAAELAKRGADVIMVCRSARRGDKARAEIVSASGNTAVDILIADLSSQQAIRRLADDVHAQYPQLHVLINNAGAMYNRRALTVDGIECTFAVNHLAYFLLAHLLLDVLEASAPARIVNVASGAAHAGTIDFADLMGERDYSRRRAYTQSKLANVVFTHAMARFTASSGVTVNCLHPGNVLTNLGGPGRRFWLWAKRLLSPAALDIRPVAAAADDVVHLALSPELAGVSGRCFAGKTPTDAPPAACDESVMQRLWQVSAELTHLELAALA